MEYRLLGPLEVLDGNGHRLPLGGVRQQSVLAALLLRADRTVALEQLVEQLWEEPPATAFRTVQVYVSRLRQELPAGAIERRAGGYAFRLDSDQLDLRVFEQAAQEGQAALAGNDCERAAQLLREALALWRGPALAGLTSDALRREAAGLEELRLQVLEDRFEADLACGRHRELVPELQALVADQPFRERPRAQLMLALYRAGRPGDALELYRETRRLLVDELGMEPGEELRKLEQAILRQDDSLGLPREVPLPDASGGRVEGASPRTPAPARTRRRRPVLLIGLACAAGGAVALSLLLPRVFREDTAAATYQPGTVLVDVKTHKKIASLPPNQLASPKFPVFSGGHVWLFNASPRSFVEIDPATGRVLTRFDPPDGMTDLPTSTPYAVDGRILWVGAGDDLVKFDIPLKEEAERFHLDKIVGTRGSTEGVALGGGLVWVGRDVGFGQVVAVDPETGELRHRFDNIHHRANVTYGGGRVWTADDGGVNVIDPSTHLVHDVPELEKTDLYFGPAAAENVVAFGGGFGWTTDPVKGVLYKIDPSGSIAAQYPVGRGVKGAFFSRGALWVRNEESGTVTGIDAITGKPRGVYRFGRLVTAEAVGAGVLVAALQPTTKDVVAGVKGKVLRLFSQRNPYADKGEPALEWNLAAGQIERATCANLLNYPDKPAPAGLQLQPEVAAAMPVLSRDKRTYTFTVRPGYRFAPPWNQPLTAETFRESIERALSPTLERLTKKLRGSDYPMPGEGLTDVRGEQRFRAGKARHISGLRANGQRLSITLTRPSPGFVYWFAPPSAFCPVPIGTPPIPGAANRRLGSSGTPDDFSMPSAGPYYVADWRRAHYVILRRNPNYHGPRPQKLDAIVLREDMDAARAVDLVRDGSWDGIISTGDVGAEHLDPLLNPDGAIAKRYGGRGSGGLQYNPGRQFQTGYLALNASRLPFSDQAVRRAAAFAVNRAKLASVWQQVPTDQLLPPDSVGFRDHRFYPLRRPNLQKAKAVMRGRRFSAVMTIQPACAPCLQEGQLVRADLGRIGIRVKLAPGRPFEVSDIADSGLLHGQPDSADFLHFLFRIGVPPSWPPHGVVQEVERVNRLYGRKRQLAAAALANRLTANVVPVIPDGIHVQGELFGPHVGCRVFPPNGVDLAALCRNGSR
jgi:DNA-binding SARP family transcriptional activator/ABC-type transport system substrate-binding protein